MSIRKYQRGYTVTELVVVIALGLIVCAMGGCVYTGLHFLGKIW